MSQETLLVVEPDSRTASELVSLVEEGMGAWQARYAVECLNQGVCRGLVAYSRIPLGAVLFYSVGLDPSYVLGVIYYVVVGEGYRRRGVGRVLVASAEHVLEEEGADVVLATTRVENLGSRRLFYSMGYREVPLHSIEEECGDLLTKLTCSYEDDLALVKEIGAGFEDVLAALGAKPNARRVERLWYSLCYRPWRSIRLRAQ